MISVTYRNNLDRVPAKIVDETTVTPRQFLSDNGVNLGNYQLQINGIPINSEIDKTFEEIINSRGIDTQYPVVLSGIKPANGGIQ